MIIRRLRDRADMARLGTAGHPPTTTSVITRPRPRVANAYGVGDYLLGQIGLALLLGVCNDHLARPLAPHPAALGG